MGWEISKSFEFCYGHRVWQQVLDSEFSENSPCKCRHLHGHESRLEVTMTTTTPGAATLERGMVTDFNHTRWLKTFLDSTIDHHFIVDCNDPLFPQLVTVQSHYAPVMTPVKLERLVNTGDVAGPSSQWLTVGREFQISEEGRRILPLHEIEHLESFFIVDFVPTSENLSKWIYDVIAWKMQRLCSVASVDWWESSKSHAKYVGDLK